MDFNQLMAKMRELDQPVGEAQTLECGEPMGMTPPSMPGMPPKQDVPPPSLSVNLNAQGMDNIEQIMKLITKVNPDAAKPELPPLPTMGTEPSIMSIKPDVPALPSLGNLDKGPLKMLPDLDADNDDKVGGEMDIEIKGLDKDSEGPEMDDEPEDDKGPEMDDEGPEEKDDEEEKEAYGNSMGDSEPVNKGNPFDATGDDLNKPKKTFPKVAGGDNPMQKMESGDLRAQIRAELLQRLAEAKGEK